jgi:hypothetical protein
MKDAPLSNPPPQREEGRVGAAIFKQQFGISLDNPIPNHFKIYQEISGGNYAYKN